MIKKTSIKTNKKHLSILIFSACSFPAAMASGYHFGTQSVSSQTTANSSAAEAADASTIYYNAAGITKLDGTNISINANVIAPNVKYSNAKASYPGMPGSQQAVKGKTSGKISKDIVTVPHLYASHKLNDQWSIGLGTYVPFASGTEYERDSVLRYNVNKTEMTAIAINPTVAFKINEQHSVALGLNAQHMSAELRQYANWGRIINPRNGNGFADGYSNVEGESWGLGYTFSYLWDVNDKARLGVNFRSKVKHKLEGTAQWRSDSPVYKTAAGAAALKGIQAPVAMGGAGYNANENVSVNVITPESLSLHGMYNVNEKWTAFGDVTWTRHSRFNSINIEFENPKVVADVTKGGRTLSNTTTLKPNWKDTFKISVGGAYQYDDKLQLRFGVAFDESPVKNADYRLSTIPDSDRIWLSLGAKYDFSKNSSLNVGYSYIHIKDSKANVNGWCGSQKPAGPGAANCVSSRTNGSAEYNSDAHVLGIQYNYRF